MLSCFDIFLPCTHVKISKLVTCLQARCQQVVFAWLVASYQGLWKKLLTTCNNLVNIVRLGARVSRLCLGNFSAVNPKQECKNL